MIEFTLSESDFDQKYNGDNYGLRSIFNKEQMNFIINAVNNTDNEKLEKIRKELLEELGEDYDVNEYPPEDCYKLIGSVIEIVGVCDE